MEYHIGYSDLNYEVVFVTGACRSGKSLLARLLGSADNVEWFFEPAAIYLPIRLAALGKIDFQYAKRLVRSTCDELVVNRILLRDTNIRFQDMSSIYSYKSMEKLFVRITTINNINDAKDYIEKKRVIIVFDIPELLPHLASLRLFFPASKIVHVVRNGFQVADEIKEKGWYTLENLKINNLMNATIYRRSSCNIGEEYFVPYWIEAEKEHEFISTTDYGRAIMYWSNILTYAVPFNGLIDMEIRYEDFVSDPGCTLKKLGDIISCQWTAKTEEVKSMLDSSYSIGGIQNLSILSERERMLFFEQMRRYKYE